jgi:hypothetical protein
MGPRNGCLPHFVLMNCRSLPLAMPKMTRGNEKNQLGLRAGIASQRGDENEGEQSGIRLHSARATLLQSVPADPVLESFANFATQQGYVKPQSIKRIGVGNRH